MVHACRRQTFPFFFFQNGPHKQRWKGHAALILYTSGKEKKRKKKTEEVLGPSVDVIPGGYQMGGTTENWHCRKWFMAAGGNIPFVCKMAHKKRWKEHWCPSYYTLEK
jgi:hypothetical protein